MKTAVDNSRSIESQTAIVWREFRRRRGAVIALWVIAAIVTIAIWAPFLANDRPFWYRGYERFEYGELMRTARTLVTQAIPAALQSAPVDDPYGQNEMAAEAAESTEVKAEIPTGWERTVVQSLQGMQDRVEEPFAAKLRQVGRDVTMAAAEQNVDQQRAQLSAIRAALVDDFAPQNVTFRTVSRFPVIAALSWLEIYFLVLNPLLLTLTWWGPRLFQRSENAQPGRGTPAVLLTLFFLPALPAALWGMTQPLHLDRIPYKAGVAIAAEEETRRAAPIVYQSVVWPLVPFGLDEDDLANTRLHPTGWTGDATRFFGTRGPNGLPNPTAHWLGTDSKGQDVLCRLIWGSRISLSVGIIAVSIYVTIGVIIGSLAGYFRGFTDLVLSRLIEVVICFPSFFLILTIVTFIGPGIFNIMIVMGLTSWTGVARLVRGEFLRLADQEFVLAARSLGYSHLRIIFRHILPNAIAPVFVSATFGIAGAILTETSLSYLGFGIRPPAPSWGVLLREGHDAQINAPWLIYFPGLAIFCTITAYNLVGETLRDAADPRHRGQVR